MKSHCHFKYLRRAHLKHVKLNLVKSSIVLSAMFMASLNGGVTSVLCKELFSWGKHSQCIATFAGHINYRVIFTLEDTPIHFWDNGEFMHQVKCSSGFGEKTNISIIY